MLSAPFTSPLPPSRPATATAANRPLPLAAEIAWRALEEVDFGVLLVDVDGQMRHANHLARQELALGRCLRLADGAVGCADHAQQARLTHGLQSAGRGRRQLLQLHAGDISVPVACVPLASAFDAGPAAGLVLLMLGRRPESQSLAVSFFARSCGMTPAEENVLHGLCNGMTPDEVAKGNGVTLGTVRTQIRSLRDKAGAPSIRHLLQRVAALPPVVPMQLGAPLPAQSGA